MKGLSVRDLTVEFSSGSERLAAVRRVSFDIRSGQTLALVGESGSGKSTVGRAICGLVAPKEGEIVTDARSDHAIQMVFQNPYASLNPRMTVQDALDEAVMVTAGTPIKRADRLRSVMELMQSVQLEPRLAGRYPHELSGGQRQRVAVARALAAAPSFLVLDEVTSALDVSVQAALLATISRLQAHYGFGCLFISHDLAVVAEISDEIAVMYLGRIVESGPSNEIMRSAKHPYTRALIASIPGSGVRSQAKIRGEVPDPRQPPSGCSFHPRCPVGPLSEETRVICKTTQPELKSDGSHSRRCACHFPQTDDPRVST